MLERAEAALKAAIDGLFVDEADALRHFQYYKAAKKTPLNTWADALREAGWENEESLKQMGLILQVLKYVGEIREAEAEADGNIQAPKRIRLSKSDWPSLPPEAHKPWSAIVQREDALVSAAQYLCNWLGVPAPTTIEALQSGLIARPALRASDDRPYKSSGKVHVLGMTGMKGVGKTEMLFQVGQHVVPFLQKRAQRPVRPLYLTFNGNGHQAVWMCQAVNRIGSPAVLNRFFQIVMHQVDGDNTPVKAIEDDLPHETVLERLQIEEYPLVILVDELGELDAQSGTTELSVHLLRELMRAADVREGKLSFVFSHLMPSVLSLLSSGRVVSLLELPLLPLDTFWSRDPEWKEACRQHPGIHQLCLSCSGHPRALFDGLAFAKRIPGLLIEPNVVKLTLARNAILEVCKFNPLDADLVEQWFQHGPGAVADAKKLELMRAEGLIHEILNSDDALETRFLNPLLLQSWAFYFTGQSKLAYHLHSLFEFDMLLAPQHEKYMEAVLFHHEAIQLHSRLPIGHAALLSSLYPTPYRGVTDVLLKRIQPPPNSYVLHLPRFHHPELKTLLTQGSIVVSDLVTEKGAEFLVPHLGVDGSVLVAMVQVKMEHYPRWPEIRSKFEELSDHLRVLDLHPFPVVLTNAIKQPLKGTDYDGMVVFGAKELWSYTKHLGVLRMHTEKLGRPLADLVPVLNRAAIEAEV